ncbi:MAG: hypothetical protein A2511_09955 [Deltaproteobacteria bacterium RIFOXYD12_FULL_50_9]|nr:MAG: hypothetical protein A2511_09955 [Deltaproteobacteria bacterium RIFOXYD12_FULL_50_9]
MEEKIISPPQKPDAPLVPEKKTSEPYSPLKILALSLCLNVVCSVGAIATYDAFFAQKVAVLDLQGFLAKQRVLLANGKITGEELVKSLDQVEVAIDKVSKNTLVILKDVVLRNATTEIVP